VAVSYPRRRERKSGRLHVDEELPDFRFEVFRLDRDGIGKVLDVGGGRTGVDGDAGDLAHRFGAAARLAGGAADALRDRGHRGVLLVDGRRHHRGNRRHFTNNGVDLFDRARRAGSVNTLIRDGNDWRGDSTDGAGLLRDLRDRHGCEPHGRRGLLLGAGGAARAVGFALADAGIGELVIANRTPGRANALAAAIGDPARACAWNELATLRDIDLVVNATAAGHADAALDLPAALIGATTRCYDLSYGAAATAFLNWARATGATRVSDGLGLLVEQAAESFALWLGVQPATAPVYADMRASVAAQAKA